MFFGFLLPQKVFWCSKNLQSALQSAFKNDYFHYKIQYKIFLRQKDEIAKSRTVFKHFNFNEKCDKVGRPTHALLCVYHIWVIIEKKTAIFHLHFYYFAFYSNESKAKKTFHNRDHFRNEFHFVAFSFIPIVSNKKTFGLARRFLRIFGRTTATGMRPEIRQQFAENAPKNRLRQINCRKFGRNLRRRQNPSIGRRFGAFGPVGQLPNFEKFVL